jgi:hypothetical protein
MQILPKSKVLFVNKGPGLNSLLPKALLQQTSGEYSTESSPDQMALRIQKFFIAGKSADDQTFIIHAIILLSGTVYNILLLT